MERAGEGLRRWLASKAALPRCSHRVDGAATPSTGGGNVTDHMQPLRNRADCGSFMQDTLLTRKDALRRRSGRGADDPVLTVATKKESRLAGLSRIGSMTRPDAQPRQCRLGLLGAYPDPTLLKGREPDLTSASSAGRAWGSGNKEWSSRVARRGTPWTGQRRRMSRLRASGRSGRHRPW